ncbi:MAG TPA: LemA family protein [Acidimicrobiales bacterium]|jgi:LemA protein
MIWVLIIVVVLVLLGGFLFNDLVKRRARTQEAWSQIDVELKRRHDLIPNLVETVKGYAAHEQGTFEAVTNARAAAVSAGATGDPAQVSAAENQLTGTLRTLFAVSENYPQLRAVESFTRLQEELTATEDKVEFARRYYNTSARDYNVATGTFPRNLFAGPLGFKRVGFFEAEVTDRAVPTVNFGTAPGVSFGGSTPSGPPVAAPSDQGPPPAP